MSECTSCHKIFNKDLTEEDLGYEKNTCNECDIVECDDCITKNHFQCYGGFEYCNDDTDYHCNKYKLICKSCNNDICKDHRRVCEECNQEGCDSCFFTHYKTCYEGECRYLLYKCANDWMKCTKCQDWRICPSHITECDGCGKIKCHHCLIRCKECDKLYCNTEGNYYSGACDVSRDHFLSTGHTTTYVLRR